MELIAMNIEIEVCDVTPCGQVINYCFAFRLASYTVKMSVADSSEPLLPAHQNTHHILSV
jgi:hypothetical protein